MRVPAFSEPTGKSTGHQSPIAGESPDPVASLAFQQPHGGCWRGWRRFQRGASTQKAKKTIPRLMRSFESINIFSSPVDRYLD